MDPQCANEQNPGEESPRYQIPTDIVLGQRVDLEVVEQPYDPETDPERAIACESAIAEAIVHLLLLETGDQLSQTAENQSHGQYWSDSAKTQIVNLQQQGC